MTGPGVHIRALASLTMAARSTPGRYFTGAAVDVTGWLGGYNVELARASC